MSYVRLDDEHEDGRLTQFRTRLAGEVRMQTGLDFPIFQDRNDIKWGQNWKSRIEEGIDASTFLIPIITPSFFNSDACREELERFQEIETELGRNDLILPIYYVDCPVLNNETLRAKDELAQLIATHQHTDWRPYRFEPFTSPQIGMQFAQMAVQIRDTLGTKTTTAKSTRKRTTRKHIGDGRRASTAKRRDSIEPSYPPEAEADVEPEGGGRAEPAKLVVDQMHRGDYVTISEAIDAAKPGYKILVRPGFYQEALVIDKPLEIIGDGELDEIVVEAKDQSAVLFKTTMGRISNLTLRTIGDKELLAVSIGSGRLLLDGCDITCRVVGGVAIHSGADPRLRGNRIHGNGGSGVFIYPNGQGTLEDNEIFSNAGNGVLIKSGANPTVRRNRVYEGESTGMFITGGGLGIIEDNDIFENKNAGISVSEKGNPTVRRNRITKNGYQAVWVFDGGGGTFEDNDLRDNERGAWKISGDSEANVVRNNNQE